MNRAMESAARGQPPVEPVIDGAFLLFAGGLLLTPGLITDALGFALLVPQVRRRVARWLFNLFLANADVVIDVRTHGPDDDRRRPSGPGVVIDGDYETVDEPERKKPRP